MYAQSISAWRHPSCNKDLPVSKIIALGTFCDEAGGTELFSDGFEAPNYWKVLSPEEPATNIVIPTYSTTPNDCGDSTTYATDELTFTFRDHVQYDKDGSTVDFGDWVYLGTDDSGNQVI